jgi:hypothetical protein
MGKIKYEEIKTKYYSFLDDEDKSLYGHLMDKKTLSKEEERQLEELYIFCKESALRLTQSFTE